MANKSKNLKLMIVAGARPNFVKIAPLFWEIKKHPEIKAILVHTGQHYDFEMSQVFFQDLDIPKPDYNLGVGSGSHGFQTGQALIELEKVAIEERPDVVVVVGDVNSTLAGALAAAKLHIPVAHIEAGLRSFDKAMPEEINRVLSDHISDYLFCPTTTAVANLKKEGITRKVFNTGDIMLDILKAKLSSRKSAALEKLAIKPKEYLLLTIHRAANVDNAQNLEKIIGAISQIEEKIIFPAHPRTMFSLEKNNLLPVFRAAGNVEIINPVSYIEMLTLEKNAKKILTDSGGVQKEAYWLKVPCITLRNETEWVETVESGWNKLVCLEPPKILRAARDFDPKNKQKQFFGNGDAARKIVKIILTAKG